VNARTPSAAGPVKEFAGLVRARESGDLKAAKAAIAALRIFGFAVCCITPREKWGGAR